MSDYDRPLVEQLLPAVWDDGYAYGMENPTAPDPDMPRAPTDPAHSGTLYAHLADIKAGWAHAPLTSGERRALFLRYGLDWPERQISRQLGVTQQAISYRLATGVGRVVDALNG
jgi:DNA-directed RNA polymerase specialized sigma24 family protein